MTTGTEHLRQRVDMSRWQPCLGERGNSCFDIVLHSFERDFPVLLWICLGGALGTGARYLIGMWALTRFGPGFPVGTLIVNVVGSFLIAVIMVIALSTEAVSPTLRAVLTTGVMGGFTTYSSFNYETLRLLQQGTMGLAATNVLVTLLGCAASGFIGMMVAGRFVG